MKRKNLDNQQNDLRAQFDLKSLVVRPIRSDEKDKWDRLMSTHHYLGFRHLVGESLKYVAELQGRWVALLGWGSATFKSGARDKWIGWSPEQQWQRLQFLANSQRFLFLPGIRIKNLASKILSINVKRLSADWQAVYGHPILLAETFVDHTRFAGTCYRAAGWIALGQTRGYGRNAGCYFYHGHPKTIFVRPLHRNARRLLFAPFLDPKLTGGTRAMLDLNKVAIDTKGELLEHLAKIKDPRKRRGIRHTHVSILAVAVCAILSGAKSFLTIGEWAANLSQDLLRRLGCRWDENQKKYIPPSEPTLRRTFQSINPDEVDRVIGDWLSAQCDGDAVAVDGKTLRGSKGVDGKAVHLISALLHKEGVVISQREVDNKSNEITAFKPLLDPLDLRNKVVQPMPCTPGGKRPVS